MSGIADVFNSDLFSLRSLTKAMNLLPVTPTRIGDMGIFNEIGVSKTILMIEQNNGVLALVPEGKRGGTGTPFKKDKRTARSFSIGHVPLEGHINADDVQDVRAFGSENSEEAVVTVINNLLASMRLSLDVTREYRRVRALHGIILDADGTTELTNLFTEFGVSEDSVAFTFTVATTDIRGTCMAVHRLIDIAVGATAMITNVRGICGATFFDALTNHDTVKAAYAGWSAAQDKLGGDVRKGFPWGGILFEEYTATVSGNAFVAADECRFFPEGAGMYAEYVGPADYMETVNTIGLPFYSKVANTKFEKGADIEAQTNPLAMPFLPASLVEGTMN